MQGRPDKNCVEQEPTSTSQASGGGLFNATTTSCLQHPLLTRAPPFSVHEALTSPTASIPPTCQPGKTVLKNEPTSQSGQPSLQEHGAARPEAGSVPNTCWRLLLPLPPRGAEPRWPTDSMTPETPGGPPGAVHGDHPVSRRREWGSQSPG